MLTTKQKLSISKHNQWGIYALLWRLFFLISMLCTPSVVKPYFLNWYSCYWDETFHVCLWSNNKPNPYYYYIYVHFSICGYHGNSPSKLYFQVKFCHRMNNNLEPQITLMKRVLRNNCKKRIDYDLYYDFYWLCTLTLNSISSVICHAMILKLV